MSLKKTESPMTYSGGGGSIKTESVATVTVKISENIACKEGIEKQLRADVYEHTSSGLLEG